MGLFNAKKDDKKSTKIPTDKKIDKKEEIKDSVSEEKSMKDLYDSEGKVKKETKKNINGRAYRVLQKPMVTEKATNLSTVNQYVFMVDINANKIEVAKAVSEIYGVVPVSVNIIKMKGKKVSRGRIIGRRKDFKKAIVTLKKGESISVYEGV